MHSQIDVVTRLLEGYAARGVFRGSSGGEMRGGKTTFRIVWHYNQTFELVVDLKRQTVSMPQLLTGVPAGSQMYRELKAFIKSRHDPALPDHRRIDTARSEASAANRKGAVGLTMRSVDADYEYAARKLVHLVQEIFTSFLGDGNYFEYLVETFDLDPDHM
jgi:hypothetical protein